MYFSEINCAGSYSFLKDLNLSQIASEDKEILEQPITLKEVKIAIKQLNFGKCPGLDVIPIEFYQKFEEELINTLHSLYIKYVEDREMNKTTREGTISLLEKVNKDQLKLAGNHFLFWDVHLAI